MMVMVDVCEDSVMDCCCCSDGTYFSWPGRRASVAIATMISLCDKASLSMM